MFFITLSSFYHIHIDLRYALGNESQALFIMSSSKTLITRENFALVYHFVRAQVCRAQPLFPYSSRAVNRQPSFRTEDSQSSSSSHTTLIFLFRKLRNFDFSDNLLEFLIFQNFPKFKDTIDIVVELCFSHFMRSILIFNIHWTKFSVHFSQGDTSKH